MCRPVIGLLAKLIKKFIVAASKKNFFAAFQKSPMAEPSRRHQFTQTRVTLLDFALNGRPLKERP